MAKALPPAMLRVGGTSGDFIIFHLTLLSLFHRLLDKLGVAALTNHTRVFRQAFVEEHYSLLDSDHLYSCFGRWGKKNMPPSSCGACSQEEGRGIERGSEVREASNSSPAATVHLGLLALSVVQETGWHQGAQRDKCSGRRSLSHSLRTLCQDTVSSISNTV